MKKVAILQSNYIPWKGYFDIIRHVDEFILFDDMQFTRRDWRNRNMIKTPQGPQWLTIAVESKGKFDQKIKDTVISDPSWKRSHWQTLKLNYAKAPHFKDHGAFIEELYMTAPEKYLSEVNFHFLSSICRWMEIPTKITWSMDYQLKDGKTSRLVDLCQQAKGQIYLSGPAAKDYIEPQLFQDAGIELTYMDYSPYLEYPQPHPPFTHAVSMIDMIFSVGKEYKKYLGNL